MRGRGSRRSGLLAFAAFAAVALVLPTATPAAIVESDGITVTLHETAPGEHNVVAFKLPSQTSIEITDTGGTPLQAGAGCTLAEATVGCPIGLGGLRLDTGAGDDSVVLSALRSLRPPRRPARPQPQVPAAPSFALPDGALVVSLGEGRDVFRGTAAGAVVDGGPGVDELLGGDGPDVLRGGEGDDRISAYDSAAMAADTVDGGEGTDSYAFMRAAPAASIPPLTITLDGVADDGRAGEHDSVVDVEKVVLPSGGRFVGDDDVNDVTVSSGASVVEGGGGVDLLNGGTGDDRIDGGVGDDRINGNRGADTIVGGPGRDDVEGDGIPCHKSPCADGADTIDVRDGEVDKVTCGGGKDRVVADDDDRVARDCELVERPTLPLLALIKPLPLDAALRQGLRFRVTRSDRPARVRGTISARVARRLGLGEQTLVASGRALGGTRTFRVFVRFVPGVRARLAAARRLAVRFAIEGSATRLVVVLRAAR